MWICGRSSNLFFIQAIEIFLVREEVFFLEFLFENFAKEDALVLVSNFYTDPQERLWALFF